jgi:anthranilate phosphoribosyltransferase
LSLLGTEGAWVVHGADGLDEITIAEKTFVAEASSGTVRTFEISPEDFGIERTPLDGLGGGDADANAKIIRDVVAGNRRDAARSLVLVNAAAALHAGGIAADVKEGMKLAEQSIDSGAAGEKLTELIQFTTREVA